MTLSTPIDLTDEDRANGWTEETLAEYRADQERRSNAVIFDRMEKRRRRRRARRTDSDYDPLKW